MNVTIQVTVAAKDLVRELRKAIATTDPAKIKPDLAVELRATADIVDAMCRKEP